MVKSWVQSLKPEDRGLAHPCARSYSCKTRPPLAPPRPVPVRLRPPLRRPVAPFWVTPGAQRGRDLYLPPCRASEGGCELTAGRARTPGPGARAARTGGPGRVGSHLTRGRNPGGPRLHPRALPKRRDTHVPGDSHL